MFFVKQLRRDILMEPQYLGAKLKDHVKHRILQELEGQCLGKHGYVISVLNVKNEDIHPGLVDNDTGAVNVTVYYRVILLRPFRNQVLDTVVTVASEESGFFAKVGPLTIFVSRYNMPDDISFNQMTGDCWVSQDEKVEIRDGSLVRLRIIGLNFDAGSMSAIGTIKETYLGQLEM
mmetsp:Transcript_7037/g.11758  ORF Transcript_7037/g.11758 Transcript_7037/m.11758 type:complete len:176 (-) Transcript_7037:126-653(-)